MDVLTVIDDTVGLNNSTTGLSIDRTLTATKPAT
jgi:hypothetical protein